MIGLRIKRQAMKITSLFVLVFFAGISMMGGSPVRADGPPVWVTF